MEKKKVSLKSGNNAEIINVYNRTLGVKMMVSISPLLRVFFSEPLKLFGISCTAYPSMHVVGYLLNLES